MTRVLIGNRPNSEELGRLGKCLAEKVSGLIPVTNLESLKDKPEVIVHCRRDITQLPAIIEYCQKQKIPLVNLSTEVTPNLPKDMQFLFLNCPNISLKVLRFDARIQAVCAGTSENFRVKFKEHHQPQKKDRSGTAEMTHDRAAILKRCQNEVKNYDQSIVSIRSLDETRRAGFDVPVEYENVFAIHEVQIVSEKTQAVLYQETLEVYGHETYAKGLSDILAVIRLIGPVIGEWSIADFKQQYIDPMTN